VIAREVDFVKAMVRIAEAYERKQHRDQLIFAWLSVVLLGVIAFLLVACQAPLR